MGRKNTRRDFLKSSAMAGVGFWVGGSVLGDTVRVRSANDKLQFAGVGVGGKGHSDILHAADLGPVVAICDIDENHLNKAAADLEKKGHSPKKFFDFRKMFEEMGSQIDAVTVSTPDHTHAPASAMAMRMKKHVYCQKPLTHTVYEARRLRELAAEFKVCTQMGNQGTAETGLRRAVEIIQAGVIGQVQEIHIWTNRPIWPQAPEITARPKDTPTCPAHVHWDEFLGPAPERPYNAAYHPFKWRGWWDFGTGALGDMACHTANMAFMACKLGYPTSVSAEAGGVNPETCPSFATVTLDFPSRGDMPALKWFWYEGKRNGAKNLPPRELLHGENPPGSGSLIVGEKAILYSPNDYGASYKYLGKNAKDVEEAAKKVTESLPRNGKGDHGQKEEWVRAIRANDPKIALSNFAYAGMLTEAVLLGNVAIRCGKKFEWNGPEFKAAGCPEADQYLKSEYRKGWTL
jgi:predicted dehydrogenase